jgi:hypothetical protein
MADWLVKTEPGDYSFEDLLRETGIIRSKIFLERKKRSGRA